MKKKTVTPSLESQQEAMKMAKAIQKPAQSKEQTRLVAQGIEKGIALYKKQQKEKQRQASKLKKKALKSRNQTASTSTEINNDTQVATKNTAPLAWGLLVISWIGFGLYYMSMSS